MSSTSREDLPAEKHHRSATDAADASAAPSPWRDRLARLLAYGKDETGRRHELRVLAMLGLATLSVVLFVWLAYSGYEVVSSYFAAKPAEVQPAAEQQEPAAEDGSREYEKARREAAAALAEAERQRQANVERMKADKHEWSSWQNTLRDVEENKRRLEEKQRAAEAATAEAERQAFLEDQRKAQEAQRDAAERAAAAASHPTAAAPKKRRLRSFD